MDNQNHMPGIAYEEQTDKGSFGWAVLGFFFHLIGLILFLVWKDTRPGDAKKAGIGALVGFCLSIVYFAFMGYLFYKFAWMGIKDEIVQQTCNTYGTNYFAREVDGVWECYDPDTEEIIHIETKE